MKLVPSHSSQLHATLTKTKEDCVNADNNVLAARPPSTLAAAFVAPGNTAVTVSIASYIEIGKNWATPPSTMKTPAARLTMRLRDKGQLCDRIGRMWLAQRVARRVGCTDNTSEKSMIGRGLEGLIRGLLMVCDEDRRWSEEEREGEWYCCC